MEISQAEYEVMCAIWQQHPCTANDVVDRLSSSKEWHAKTVKTMLGRLVKKGALDYKKEQRHYVYSPLIEQRDYQQQETQSFVERLFQGRLSPLVAGFAKESNLTKEDVDELKQIITDWEKNND